MRAACPESVACAAVLRARPERAPRGRRTRPPSSSTPRARRRRSSASAPRTRRRAALSLSGSLCCWLSGMVGAAWLVWREGWRGALPHAVTSLAKLGVSLAPSIYLSPPVQALPLPACCCSELWGGHSHACVYGLTFSPPPCPAPDAQAALAALAPEADALRQRIAAAEAAAEAAEGDAAAQRSRADAAEAAAAAAAGAAGAGAAQLRELQVLGLRVSARSGFHTRLAHRVRDGYAGARGQGRIRGGCRARGRRGRGRGRRRRAAAARRGRRTRAAPQCGLPGDQSAGAPRLALCCPRLQDLLKTLSAGT